MAISKAVINHAAENGYKFYIQGCGYRALVEITDLDNKHIGWTSNRSALALNSINALINQKRLATKSDAAIATEAAEAHAMIEVAPDRRRYYERTSYMGIGVEVYCGDERYGYALAELLDRPVDVDDSTLERQRMEQRADRDSDRMMTFPVYTYDLMKY